MDFSSTNCLTSSFQLIQVLHCQFVMTQTAWCKLLSSFAWSLKVADFTWWHFPMSPVGRDSEYLIPFHHLDNSLKFMIFNPHSYLFKVKESPHWKIDNFNLSSSELLLPHSGVFWGEIIKQLPPVFRWADLVCGPIGDLFGSIRITSSYHKNSQDYISFSWTVAFMKLSQIAQGFVHK